MHELKNEKLMISVNNDGSKIMLCDLERNITWNLDPDSARYRCGNKKGKPDWDWRAENSPGKPLGNPKVSQKENCLILTYQVPEGKVEFAWSLTDDYVQIELQCDGQEIDEVSQPGNFYPESGEHELLLPLSQGSLIRKGPEDWRHKPGAGDFSLAMGAVLSEQGALLITQEDPSGWCPECGQRDGELFFSFYQTQCPTKGWGKRTVRLYTVENDITAICKRYRQLVMERGEFVSWEEKIARKPILKNLFGSLMAFIGYNQTTEIDYIASMKKLKSYGFDSIMFYPVRMALHSMDLEMGGGDRPIGLSDDIIRQMKEEPGVLIAPWIYSMGCLDDGTEETRRKFRRLKSGDWDLTWTQGSEKFYSMCTAYQIEFVKNHFQTDMKVMDWAHFDVNATDIGTACCNKDHGIHGNKPIGDAEDQELIKKILSHETVGDTIVSSEGFHDAYAGVYDIGTAKSLAACGKDTQKIPVPMTMLVFHDSMVHDWHEHSNYNKHAYSSGSGNPELKAVGDALGGCPPNVFPFGKHRGFVPNTEQSEIFTYFVRLEDEEVQRALKAALPIAKLHKKIGMLELTSFDFLSEDFAIQTTTFSDGTRIVGNLSEEDREVEGYGVIPALSWLETGTEQFLKNAVALKQILNITQKKENLG